MNATCEHCGTDYVRKHPRGRFCGSYCRNTALRREKGVSPRPQRVERPTPTLRVPRVPATCPQCGKESLAKVACQDCRRAAWNDCQTCGKKTPNERYCSRGCWVPDWGQPHTCEGCGEQFTRRRRGGGHSDKDALRYCSRECSSTHRTVKKWDWVCYLVHSTCEHCGSLHVGRYARRYCDSVCRYHATKVPTVRPCLDCGADIIGAVKRCEPCRVVAKKRAKAAEAKRRKQRVGHGRNANVRGRKVTRVTGAAYEWVRPLRVFERDKWICGLCGDRINPASKWPDQMSPSVDHIVPLSLGGDHTYANIQAAHWLCNVLKSDDPTVHFRAA